MQKKILVLSFFLSLFVVTAHADTPIAVPAGTEGAPAASAPAVSGGTAAVAAPERPSLLGSFAPLLIMFGVIYFLMLRPQQKKQKEQQEMLKNLQNGDEVVTTSGILGTVAGLTEKVVTLEVSNNVKLKMLRSQVQQVLKGGGLSGLNGTT